MNQFSKNIALWLVIILVMLMLYNVFNEPTTSREAKISYSNFISMVEQGKIKSVTMQDKNIFAIDTNDIRFHVFAPNDPDLIKTLKQYNVSIIAKEPAKTSWFLSMIISWLPMIILIGVWFFFMQQMQGGGGGGKALSFGRSKAKLIDDNEEKVTFADVAGIEEAKEELMEVVSFLREPDKYIKIGARIPKGVLLVGSPGTGKTLIARAVAGEAGVPFFTISGSDFVEMFVGVGASRVRDLFARAKKYAPCIIFIDEIDAVGRQRGAGLGGGHDEREQTLNQLLVEMDGFKTNEGVILISATNRPDVLDPALLRPGRFDRQVVVDMPDLKGRKSILDIYIKKTIVEENIDIIVLAKGTPGFSGADLENLVNEAALLAARKGKEKITKEDFEDAKDKVFMGLERKSKIIKEEDKKTTAYHEAGHALVGRLLPNSDPVNKVTIIPRGRAAGVTWFLPDERDFKYKDQLESDLVIAFGGRVAEEIVFNRISTGASNDIKNATNIARKMVREWGMDAEVGPLSFNKGEEQIFLGKGIDKQEEYSDLTAQKIDAAVYNLIMTSYNKSKTMLKENEEILHALAKVLLEKETVLGKELDELILSFKPDVKLSFHDDTEIDKAFAKDKKDKEDKEKSKTETVA